MLDAFLRLQNGEAPDEVVWTADITYWLDAQRQAGTAEPEWGTEEGFLRLHRELGIMPYYYYMGTVASDVVYAGGVEATTETSPDGMTQRIRTPLGDLVEEFVFLPESCCYAPTKYLVESPGDLDIFLYALERRRLVPVNLEDYAERAERWREYDGLPVIDLRPSPLPAFGNKIAGVESMVYLLADCEDKVRRALAMMREQDEPILDAVCELAPPLVHFTDNLSSDNFTPYYEKFMREDHEYRVNKLHAAGVKCAVHLDGTVKGLLPKLVSAGFDAVEALTPKPVGDLTVGEMQDVAGSGSVILWGGVPGAMFAPPFTWERMERHVEHVLECWRGRPFVLGTADQIPPDGDISFCRKIADMLRE